MNLKQLEADSTDIQKVYLTRYTGTCLPIQSPCSIFKLLFLLGFVVTIKLQDSAGGLSFGNDGFILGACALLKLTSTSESFERTRFFELFCDYYSVVEVSNRIESNPRSSTSLLAKLNSERQTRLMNCAKRSFISVSYFFEFCFDR